MGKGKGGVGYRLFRALVPHIATLSTSVATGSSRMARSVHLTASKCVGRLHNKTHDAPTRLCERVGTSDGQEVREVASIRFVLYFDDEERSDTYAEHVSHCPDCGVSLVDSAIREPPTSGPYGARTHELLALS